MLLSFQVTIPANGTPIALEIENADAPVEFTPSEVMSSYGGDVYLRNTGTVDCLLGGNDQNCYLPLKAADPMTPRMQMGPNDSLYAKISSGAVAGQITVLKRLT